MPAIGPLCNIMYLTSNDYSELLYSVQSSFKQYFSISPNEEISSLVLIYMLDKDNLYSKLLASICWQLLYEPNRASSFFLQIS